MKEETSILQGEKTYFLLLPVSPCISDLLNFTGGKCNYVLILA